MDDIAYWSCISNIVFDGISLLLQVPGTTNYSMVFYFVTKKLIPNSLLQRFVDGDDEFRNSRFKLIPSVPKVWCFVCHALKMFCEVMQSKV